VTTPYYAGSGNATDENLTAIAGDPGATPPALASGASGLMGWLRQINDTLAGSGGGVASTVAISQVTPGTTNGVVVNNTSLAVTAASLPLPSGAATDSNNNTIAGSAGTSPPALATSASGLIGWLRKIVDTLTGGIAVTGTFWQATQPVSAASLPLPSGASTSAKQPALGTAGSASADVLSVQGIASMTALKVDGSAVTQPVSASSLPLPSGAATDSNLTTIAGAAGTSPPSLAASASGLIGWLRKIVDTLAGTLTISGTVTANAGTNLNTSALALDATLTGGTQQTKITDGTNVATVKAASTAAAATDKAVVVAVSPNNTIPVSAASLPLPAGASTSAKQPALGTAGSASADVLTVQGVASMTALKVDGSGVTQPVSAASLPLPTGAAQDATLTGGTQKNRITDGTNEVAVKAASTAAVAADKALVVAVSPNNTIPISAASLPLPSGAAADATLTGGTQQSKITDGTNVATVKAASTAAVAADKALVVAQSPNTYATTVARLVSAAATTNATSVKGSAGRVFKIRGYNAKAAVCYLKLYNKATAPAPATDNALIIMSIPLKASDMFDIDLGAIGLAFSTGIGFALTGASSDTDATALVAADVVGLNILYA
jgi:hypothetical protein